MHRQSVRQDIKVVYKVSFGGPRDDRYFDMVFLTTMDFQMHMYKSYQKIIYDAKKQIKSCTYVERETGEEIGYCSPRGILFFSPVGPLWFNPETVGFDMLGTNPIV